MRILLLLCLICCCPVQARAQPQPILFVAASLSEVITELHQRWQDEGGGAWRVSLAASSTLARQIEYGAPAHIFISANRQWMEYLQQRGRLQARPWRALAVGRLVLVTAADNDQSWPHPRALLGDLPHLLAPGERLALGDPEHVPAGIYARRALESLGHWPALAQRLAPARDARATLAMVATRQTPLGVVYATDVLPGRVRVLADIPAQHHPPIRYLAAAVVGQDHAASHRILDFIASPDVQNIWQARGFDAPDPAP